MTSPGARLDNVVSRLVGTLLEVLAGSVDGSALITDVVVDDPREQAPVRPGAMLLCTAADVRDLPTLLDRAVTRQAPALVVRAPLDLEPELRARIERSGVVLLGLAGGATWAQLVVLLRSLLSSSGSGEELLAGMPAEDSFALANAIGSLLDAPITIEDRDSQILAFSDRQNEADQTRIETILGRGVPQHARLAQERAGVFKRLYAGEKPIFIDTPRIEGVPGLPRVAIAVRAGDQVLGSIWAAVAGPLSDEKEQVLVDAAKVVALQLLRHRIGTDIDRQIRADLVATALSGDAPASGAIERLGLAHRTVAVLGLSLPHGNSTDTAAAGQTRRQTLERITDSFAFHLSVAVPGAVAALVGDVCYAIVPTPIRKGKEDVTAMAQRVSNDFLDRARGRPGGVEIGIGREVSSSDPADLARSRHDADRTLRVLRQEPAGRVATVADVQVDALLLEIGDQLRNEGGLLDGPIARLRHHDRENGTTMTETVALWLDHLGNTLNASAAMDVHPNTFRYRLRRAAEIAQLNLDDPDERFAAMLEFRLTRQRPSAEDS
ncbi:helix-turn-helix domain-containing protein [Streptomyces europaeiscabiei]|uniref:PucR family transcriptional regulator n=1 Tax=Streptomyces TaxID=1883 RepID=UPI00117D390F|nr:MULTISPECIES: helix-turn-helix domain-containing protein [Streptomyces]MDX3630397.1 helix-turn-helix domain-containing protein [Streptomyces europaeiscabiei]MDX3648534.1 helix-turn-helix domain-containing protein [Streptomyces europaeiscabiei]